MDESQLLDRMVMAYRDRARGARRADPTASPWRGIVIDAKTAEAVYRAHRVMMTAPQFEAFLRVGEARGHEGEEAAMAGWKQVLRERLAPTG